MFNYNEAFSRNIGLVTKDEQEILRSKRIAIAGVGGVGGTHALTLARMGIMNFKIADMDIFEEGNFNRQIGAEIQTVGREKVEVIKEKILQINPEAHVTLYKEGVTCDNIDDFLHDIDLYVDGLDFFVLDMRAEVFRKCQELGIYGITAGPIGLSTAMLVFDPNGMSFEDYFQLKGREGVDKAVHFLVGLSPKLVHRHHIVDFDAVNLQQKRGPSLAPACAACSAVIGVEALKILLKRGRIQAVPWHMQFDMYQNKYHKSYNFMGNRNPWNKVKIKLVHKMALKTQKFVESTEACLN